jgi:hypothetical protein
VILGKTGAEASQSSLCSLMMGAVYLHALSDRMSHLVGKLRTAECPNVLVASCDRPWPCPHTVRRLTPVSLLEGRTLPLPVISAFRC